MLRKDKKKVIGEEMSDEQIAAFLHYEPADDTDPGFYKLERAYRSLRPKDFERFVLMLKAQGGNLNATNPDGKSILDIIRQHASSKEYAEILTNQGAGN